MQCKITLLSVGLLLTCVSYAATMSVQPSALSVALGQTFPLNVNVMSVTDLYAFQFDLAFNPTVLSVVSLAEGAFLPGGGATTFVPGAIDNLAGLIAFTADALTGITSGVDGNGNLMLVQFRALSAGTSPITLSNLILLNSQLNDIEATTASGSVAVTSQPPTLAEPPGMALIGVGLLAIFSGTVFSVKVRSVLKPKKYVLARMTSKP